MRKPARSVACRAVWLGVLVLFVAFAWRAPLNEVRQWGRLNASPTASTDGYFDSLLGISRGTEAVQAVLEKIPEHGPILFVAPAGDHAGQFVAYALSYLSWPRQIRVMTNEAAIAAADREPTPAIFFRVPPPAGFEPHARLGAECVVGSLAPPSL